VFERCKFRAPVPFNLRGEACRVFGKRNERGILIERRAIMRAS